MTGKPAILHLGLGAFHRAHQAAFQQNLIDAGDDSWRLVAGNIRPGGEDTIAALIDQGGAYTLETVAADGARDYLRINALSAVVPYAPGIIELLRAGADAQTRIISFTVTEAGYYLDAHDRLDATAPDMSADLDAFERGLAGCTIYGALAAILRRRRAAGAGAVTLLCCDNLRSNGARSRGGLLQFLELAGARELRDWVEQHTTSPNSMVDRITPRPPVELPDRVRAATMRDDRAPVMAERFVQWVIEDDFRNGRPAWEDAGVEFVASVLAHEEAKIRILNASHSAIAWAGTLAGCRFIHEGVADPRIRRIVHDYVSDDVIPCLSPSPLDLERYRDTVLERFGNGGIADTNARVAADSPAKLRGFVIPTIRDRLARGESIAAVAMLPALFLATLRHRAGADALAPADPASLAIARAPDPVLALCADESLWGGLAGDARIVAEIRRACERVARQFARA